MNCERKNNVKMLIAANKSFCAYLGIWKVVFDHLADVGRVALIESGVHLVKNVDGRGIVSQQSQNERQRDCEITSVRLKSSRTKVLT